MEGLDVMKCSCKGSVVLKRESRSRSTVNAPNSDAPSSGQALISEQFLGDQFFYVVKSSQ